MYHPRTSEEKWIWIGWQLEDDYMRCQNISGGSYDMPLNSIC